MSGSVLHTSDGRLRFIWTALVFVTGASGGAYILSLLPWWDTLGREMLAVWITLYSFLLVRIIERRPVATLGLSWTIFSPRHAAGGWIVGSFAVTVTIIICIVAGGAEISLPHSSLAQGASLLATQFVGIVLAAWLEEVLFRGYLFQIALERMSVIAVTIIGSALFASLHFVNPHFSLFALINTFLAGIWFSAAYLRTRQLWLPIALHASWNFTLSTIWGIAVSGISLPHLLNTELTGMDWLTGGEYGPEGGFAATLMVIAAIGITMRASLFQISPDQFALRHRVRFAEDDGVLAQHSEH